MSVDNVTTIGAVSEDELAKIAMGKGAPQGVFYYNTWKQAPSYREPKAGAKPIGRLKAGHNYFYYQRKFNVKAEDSDSQGKYWSTWWALTDDDSGNTNVWVSCIYFKGGANDQPVEGLPVQ